MSGFWPYPLVQDVFLKTLITKFVGSCKKNIYRYFITDLWLWIYLEYQIYIEKITQWNNFENRTIFKQVACSCKKTNDIENLKRNIMLDLLGQAWQSGSALAALTSGRATVNKHRLCGPLLGHSYYNARGQKIWILDIKLELWILNFKFRKTSRRPMILIWHIA